MRAVYSRRSSFPTAARITMGSVCIRSRSDSTLAASSYFPAVMQLVISNTRASSTGSATALMSSMVIRSCLAYAAIFSISGTSSVISVPQVNSR